MRLSELSANDKVLELGGGSNPVCPGRWTNLDCRELPGVDIVASLEETLPIEDESYDGVFCSYAIEHIPWRKVRDFLSEVRRILKPEGRAIFITANLKEQAKLIGAKDRWDGDFESCLIFGDQDYPENTHRVGFSPEYAERLFGELGFQAKVEPHPSCPTDMVITAVKTPLDRLTWVRNEVGKLTKDKPDALIVDIGCADCPITYDMANCTWVDSDSYEKVAQDMRTLGRTQIPREKFIQASADDLPFENKIFEVALNTELLEHVADPAKVLKETKRVARHVIITVPDEYSWSIDHKPFQNIGHVRHYTESMLKEHLKEAKIKKYSLDKLDYQGWSFFTVVADLGTVSTVKKRKLPKLTSDFYDKEATALVVRLSGDRLKVALLSTPFIRVPPRNYGGLELVLRDEAYALAKQGHQVTVFAPDDSYVEGCEMVFFGPALEKVQVNWLQAETDAINKVSSRLMNDGYDIICGHDWFGMEYALKAQRPELRVCHVHHGGLNMDWWGTSKPPWPLNLIAISKWMQKVYQSQGFTSRVVYNGIAIEDYLFKATKDSRLLFVGRLDSFKRPLVAIEVARKAGLGLDIVGGSFVADVAYMEKVKQACDGEQIKLYLDAPHEKKVELYQNAKAVIFPSKMGEPFGLIVPEANACGTSVIATPDGAIPETLQDGVTGFICYTIDAMVKAVGKVDLIKPEACRERVKRLFTREIMAKNYLEAYRDILLGKEW